MIEESHTQGMCPYRYDIKNMSLYLYACVLMLLCLSPYAYMFMSLCYCAYAVMRDIYMNVSLCLGQKDDQDVGKYGSDGIR